MTRFGGNSIPGGEVGSMSSAVLLACQWVCQGKDNLCGGICVRFMLCLLNLKKRSLVLVFALMLSITLQKPSDALQIEHRRAF